jgi:hypothetical protein
MIEASRAVLFIPGHLKKFKLDLFNRIGRTIVSQGGYEVRGDFSALDRFPDDMIPIVGCTLELHPMIEAWRKRGRTFVYWDRGYFRRIFATDLPTGADGGYYRWQVNAYQMREIRSVPGDRWEAARTDLWSWGRNGRHIVVAEPSPSYQAFHGITGWKERTVEALRNVTDRPLIYRDKEMQRFGRKLHDDLRGAHCLVTHGSNAAVEAVIMGCPVVVHPDSAAALVGLTDIAKVETPLYPDREPWVRSLAYNQWNERELVDGTLWRMLEGEKCHA